MKDAARQPGLGARLRAAREAAGFSQRELAQRLGLSHVSVSHAERGADLRHDTLRRYLRALPGLRPDDLLGGGGIEPAQTREQVWEWYRDASGIEAASVTRETHVGPKGERLETHEVRGLRSVRREASDLRLLHGLERLAFAGSVPVLREIEAESADASGGDEVRSQVIEKDDGLFLHQVVVPRRLAREGLRYRWSREQRRVSMSRAESAARFGLRPEDVISSGFAFAPTYPIRRLTLNLHLPEDFKPDRVYATAWPGAMSPDPEMEDIGGRAHPEGLRLRRDRKRHRYTLRVALPLIGISYGLGWDLP